MQECKIKTTICIKNKESFSQFVKVFRRHEESGLNTKYNSEMSQINQQVEKLHQQFQIRANGENGVAKRLIDLSNPMETWYVSKNVRPLLVFLDVATVGKLSKRF